MWSKALPALLVVAVLVFAIALSACGGDDGDESPAAGDTATASESSATIEIVETDFKLDPATVELDGPGTYTFRALNQGETTHALEIEGQGLEEETEELEPGESGELTVEITEPGEYELYCPVGNHREMGMVGTVTVAAG
jgi:uncharacterized cupredoxin-like copper-binding protein